MLSFLGANHRSRYEFANGGTEQPQICGPPTYTPPDVCAGFAGGTYGSYTSACDMWSMGVIFYIMLTGQAPFDFRNCSPSDWCDSTAGGHRVQQLGCSTRMQH